MKSKRIERLVTEFLGRIRKIANVGHPVIYIFGSAARSEMEEGSDIDLLVVLDSRDEEIEREISDIAFNLSIENDILINEIVYSKEVYESKRFRATPFFENLQKEGVPV